MNDREKLKRIIEKAAFRCLPSSTQPLHINMLTTELLANGVTIQRWIPVTERLPEPFVSVVVHMPLEEPMPTVHEGFLVDEEKWYAAHFDREKDEISHWMPLPEPPKEVE